MASRNVCSRQDQRGQNWIRTFLGRNFVFLITPFIPAVDLLDRFPKFFEDDWLEVVINDHILTDSYQPLCWGLRKKVVKEFFNQKIWVFSGIAV